MGARFLIGPLWNGKLQCGEEEVRGWLCCANPILPKHPSVYILCSSLSPATRRDSSLRRAPALDHPGPGRKSASCATTLASAFSCAAMASACFRQGLCRGGGAGKHFFQLRGFAQKFLLLGRVQPGLGLGALRFRLGDTLPGMSGGRGGGRIGLGKGVGLKGISAMRFALSRKASTFGMVYNK